MAKIKKLKVEHLETISTTLAYKYETYRRRGLNHKIVSIAKCELTQLLVTDEKFRKYNGLDTFLCNFKMKRRLRTERVTNVLTFECSMDIVRAIGKDEQCENTQEINVISRGDIYSVLNVPKEDVESFSKYKRGEFNQSIQTMKYTLTKNAARDNEKFRLEDRDVFLAFFDLGVLEKDEQSGDYSAVSSYKIYEMLH